MTAHDHHSHDHHGHDHDEASELSETELRVRALQTILIEKGYTDPAALDAIVETYETKIGPHIGARIVARAWTDPAFRQALLTDASKAAAPFGYQGKVGDHLVAVENTPDRHNIVVCTLCSCYPWDVLGLPPVWYKSFAYRSRAVKEPRAVLREFGVTLPDQAEIRVWDSTAEVRYLVLPERPTGTEGWTEEQLAALVTRDSMIGTGLPRASGGRSRMNGIHDMGGMDGFGAVDPDETGRSSTANGKARSWRPAASMGAIGAWNIDQGRYGIEHAAAAALPHVVLSSLAGAVRMGAGQVRLCRCRRDRRRPCAAPGQDAATGQIHRGRSRPVRRRGTFTRPEAAPPRFAVGDRVLARNMHPKTPYAAAALRPRPCRRRRTVHGCHVFRTAPLSARARTHNGFTLCASMARSVGAGYRSDGEGFGRGVRALSGTRLT